MQKHIDFNGGFKFHFGDIVSVRNRWAWAKSGSFNQGPESRDYDDSDWKQVTIPHDFVFETEVYNYSEREFGKDNAIPKMEDVNNIHTTAGSFDKNVGWYRKHFFIPREYEGKKLFLIFEGVYRDSTFFLNEFYLKRELDGYSKIVIDITDTAAYGEDNLLAVRCDARQAEGWFYEGGGIYRNVYLEVTEQEYIDDLFVHGTPSDDYKNADIKISGKVFGIADSIIVTISKKNTDGDKTVFEQKVSLSPDNGVDGSIFFETAFRIDNPSIWSLEERNLYKLSVSLLADNEIKYVKEQTFGIRKTQFDPDKGFLINDKNVKIKGVCCHQNHGGLGSAVLKEVSRYRILKLKEMGANGYRCSHYPVTEDFLDICDEEGMLVMCETRLLSSSEEDMFVLERMVKFSRNHPCVILYSIGNEEAQSQATKQGARISRTMKEAVRRLDPYTPVTMALLMLDLKNKAPITDYRVLEGISKELDVAGFNYHSELYEKFHREYPDQPFICTEQGTFRSTRSCYRTDKEKCHAAITEKRDYYMLGAKRWRDCIPKWISGLFIWTGFDYYGEPTPFAWPAISSQFGAMDLCGYPKDFYYFYKSWWSEEDVIHVYPDMDQEEGVETDYYVFSNAEEVELFLNGKSLGRKKMPKDDYLVWENIISEKGRMEAVGYKNNIEVMRKENVTSDPSSAELSITEDYSEGDVIIRKLALLDKNNNLVTGADIRFDIPSEYGELLGASNGDPSDHTPGKAGYVNTFHGLAQVITRKNF
mgnify:CR=1 FL=1